MLPGALDLSFASTLAVMDGVTESIQRFLDAHVPDEDLAFRISLVASEAITNAIEHGNRLDATKSAHFRIRTTADEARVEVEDEGPGFDPDAVPHPLREGPLLAEGGRGLFLMRHLADVVEFEREGRCCLLVLRPR